MGGWAIGMHLRGNQHLAQERLQLRVHLRQRLLQGGWLDALIRSALILVRNLHPHSACAQHASHKCYKSMSAAVLHVHKQRYCTQKAGD